MVSLLLKHVGLPDKLSALGITKAHVGRVIKDCMARGDFRNNPRDFTPDEATRFLEAAV